jgi:hypothetical protein
LLTPVALTGIGLTVLGLSAPIVENPINVAILLFISYV